MKIIIGVAVLALLYAISWSICIGIIYLICLCFSWKFSVLTATGVWLIFCLIKGAFSTGKKK